MQRIILHLDMNSYFASVEQQLNPFLRGKPVGVCAYLSTNGCIIASSIEAKQAGIKTGCRVKEAKKLYPKVILVENEPNKYRSATTKLFKILTSYSGLFEPYSIDEAFLDLTGLVVDFNQAAKVAKEIRQRIKQEIGQWLKCSIGISYTKFLAKFCSDSAAVDGTKIFKPTDSFQELYQDVKLIDVWGINNRLERRLNILGIDNLLDLKSYPVQNLMQTFGKQGYFLWAKLNGLEVEHLRTEATLLSKSVGHSYCLPKKTADKKYLSAILAKLTEKTGQRLRARNQLANGLYIHWRYVSGGVYSKSLKLKSPVFSTEEIFQKLNQLLIVSNLKDKISMLAMGVFSLSPLTNQLRLFGNNESRTTALQPWPPVFFPSGKNTHSSLSVNSRSLVVRDEYQLIKAIDKINSHYGNYAVYRGRLWKTENLAIDRIGFRKVDGLLD